MNDQDIFDTVSKHLLTQGKKSVMNPTGEAGDADCAYRGVGGLKCAIGCLIPDDRYHAGLEGESATSPEVKLALGDVYNNSGPCPGFLIDLLQQCHDRYLPDQWAARLDKIADLLKLNRSCDVST